MTTDKARELSQQIETSVNALAAETDAARRSDIFRGWLNAMAQFHNYSWLRYAQHSQDYVHGRTMLTGKLNNEQGAGLRAPHFT